jgi:hypothetical protein
MLPSFSRVVVAGLIAAMWMASPRALYGQATGVVLTDPLVRQIQIGPPPVGAVTGWDPATGVGIVVIPGIGVRRARLVGVPVSWAGKRVVRAVDLDTDVEFTAVLPDPPQLVPATVVRAAGDAILVRRRLRGATVTDAVPVGSVFAAKQGGVAPATRVAGALRRGSTVLIPPDTKAWARVIVRSDR